MFFFCLCRIYYWYDEKGKKTKCTAPQYVDFVMSLCQKLVTDEEIFPTKYGESVFVLACMWGCSFPIYELKLHTCAGRASNSPSYWAVTMCSLEFCSLNERK